MGRIPEYNLIINHSRTVITVKNRVEMDGIDKQIFHLKDAILLAEFKDGGVAFNKDSRDCHELNRTGVQILNLLDGRRSIADVVELLAEVLDESKETIKKDTEVFLEEVIGRGWVNASHK